LPRQLTTGRVGSNRCRPTGRGEAQSQYSIRINMQWRICFEWPDGQSGPSNVEIVDYH
jgi:plasmid maintenance system killer protein